MFLVQISSNTVSVNDTSILVKTLLLLRNPKHESDDRLACIGTFGCV